MKRRAAVGFILLFLSLDPVGVAGPGLRQSITFGATGFSSLELQFLWMEQTFSASLGGVWEGDGFAQGRVGGSVELAPFSLMGGFTLERAGEWQVDVGGGFSGDAVSVLGTTAFGPDGIRGWGLGSVLEVPPLALQARVAWEGPIKALLGISLTWEALQIAAMATWVDGKTTGLQGNVGLMGELGTVSLGAIVDTAAHDLYLTTEFDLHGEYLSFGLQATWDPTSERPLSPSGLHASLDDPAGPMRYLVKLVAEATVAVPPPSPGAPREAGIAPLISSPGKTVFVAGEEIRFSARGSRVDVGPAEYLWDFGDGTSARGVETYHRYAEPGLYRVVLTIRDRAGNSASVDRLLRIAPPKLVADFSWSPEEPTVLDEVRFRDLSCGEIVSWHWDFGDGATADLPEPTHRYGAKGTFTVTLTVVDRYGNTASASKELRVVNIPPTADPGGPYEGFVYEEIVFSAGGSTDPDGEIVSYIWDFGDGTGGQGIAVVHVYRKPGTYAVCLTVVDDDGAGDTACTVAEITVCYPAPEGNR